MEQLIKYSLLLTIVFHAHNIHAISMDQRTWEKIKNRQFRIVDFEDNDVTSPVTLQEIYGVPLNEQNFNPGDKFINFLQTTDSQSTPTIQLSTQKFPDPDIHFHEFQHMIMATKMSKQSKLLKITGAPRTGKTSTLRWVYLKHITESPGKLAIFVDLPRIADSLPTTNNPITLNDILRATVPEHLVGLIEDVSNTNPGQIKIFLDGIDQVVPDYQHKIVSFISDLYSKNIPIVLSHYTEVNRKKMAPLKNFASRTVSITDSMSLDEIKAFTKRHWIKKLKKIYNQNVQTVDDYWTGFRVMTQGNPLPQTIGMARQLADYVTDPTIEKPFIDLTDYVSRSLTKNSLDYRKTIELSETHEFPKMQFYNEYLKNLSPRHLEFYMDAAIGILSRKLSVHSREWRGLATKVRESLQEHGSIEYPYLIYNNNKKSYKFTHEDFMYYFAARRFMENLSKTKTITQLIKIMPRWKSSLLLEMINSELATNPDQYEDIKLKLALWDEDHDFIKGPTSLKLRDIYAALDNIIKNRLDSLASIFLDLLDNKNSLIPYLEENIVLNAENRHCFGMIIEHFVHSRSPIDEQPLRNYEDYFPRKAVSFHGTRPQIIANLLMQRSIEVTKNAGFHWDTTYFLEIYAKQSIAGFRQMLTDYSHTGKPYSVEVLNKAMYESVKALGPDSIEILRELQRLGGVPSEVNVDGSTLAHVAVRWNSVELVKSLHESFGVSLVDKPDNSGTTILFAALNASPFPTVTREGFWPMMEYLVEKADLTCNIQLIAEYPELHSGISKLPSVYLTLLLPTSLPGEISSAASVFDLYPIDNMAMGLADRSIRRSQMIKSCIAAMYSMKAATDHVTITEILTKYRGFGQMSPAGQVAYENTIVKSLAREAKTSLTSAQVERVFTNVVKNMNAESELKTMWGLYVKKVEPFLPSSLSGLANKVFINWQAGRIRRMKTPANFLSQMLLARYDLSLAIKPDVEERPNIAVEVKKLLWIKACDF